MEGVWGCGSGLDVKVSGQDQRPCGAADASMAVPVAHSVYTLLLLQCCTVTSLPADPCRLSDEKLLLSLPGCEVEKNEQIFAEHCQSTYFRVTIFIFDI